MIKLLGRLLCLLPLCLLSPTAPAQVQQQTGTPVVPTGTDLMSWAETAYPTLFPGPQVNQSFQRFTYRYYPTTRNYVGVDGSDVYIWGPVSGNAAQPVRLGVLADYACQVDPAPCGVKFTHRVNVGGLAREFIVYRPFKAVAPSPAVLMIHGTSGDGQRLFDISGWRELADREGMIAVFPSALVHCFYGDENRNGLFDADERQVTTKWAAGTLGVASERPLCSAAQLAQLPAGQRAQADHPLADDMAFFAQIVETLRTQYAIDMKRIYVSGFSNGAEMSARLLTQASTTYAAAAVNAGNLNVPAEPAPRAMSVVLAIGELDPGIGGNQLGYPSGIPLDASVMSNPAFVNNMVTPFATVLGLNPSAYSHQLVQRNGTTLSQLSFASSLQGSTNTFRTLIIAGADHQYPNGSNHPLKMAELLWEFFRDQRLP